MQALIKAAARGKQVTALVEIKARFDEERNIDCADRLTQAGVHVVHGVMNLKTHCKVALVVRRESDGLQTYVHVATGNYNPTTSKVYTDLGLLTADREIGEDATDLFNFLTGFSRQKEYSRLLVAPVNLRERMLSMIERETSTRAQDDPHILSQRRIGSQICESSPRSTKHRRQALRLTLSCAAHVCCAPASVVSPKQSASAASSGDSSNTHVFLLQKRRRRRNIYRFRRLDAA
jgi:hypothetical protein